jgi:hypothetical protein
MINIIKTLAVAIVCAVALAAPTQAADPVAVWKNQIQAGIDNNQAIVDRIATKYRDANCTKQPTVAMQDTCVAAYNLIIAREQIEVSELLLLKATAELPASQRDPIAKLVSDYNAFDQQTHALGDQVDLLFPVPRQSSSLEK